MDEQPNKLGPVMFIRGRYGHGGRIGYDRVERLSYYQMLPEMGPPETVIYEFPCGDNSWEYEFREVSEAIGQGKPLSMGSISDAYEALKIVKRIYENRSR